MLASSPPRSPHVADTAANCLSICAGTGGLDLGVELGSGGAVRTVCYIEREARSAEVLAARMAEEALAPAPVWSDVRTFDAGRWRGVVDCVIAGIPCQGYSMSGKRKLHIDPRDLWPDTRRVLRDLGSRCRLFFLENVYGLVVPNRAARHGAPVARILGELAADGWDAEWLVLAASDVGASHRRRRVFVLAHRPVRGRGIVREPHRRDGQPPHGGASVADGVGKRSQVRDPGHPKKEKGAGRSGGALELAQCSDAGARNAGLFAPGPSVFGEWFDVLAHARPDLAPALPIDLRGLPAELAEAAEPALRGVADGPAGRMERLQALGNGVVPLQAAVAFRVLADRLWHGA